MFLIKIIFNVNFDPRKYTNFYIVWQHFSVLFFAISAFFELLCVLLYAYVFPKIPIVKYYRARAAAQGSKTVSADLAAGGIQDLPMTQVHYYGWHKIVINQEN